MSRIETSIHNTTDIKVVRHQNHGTHWAVITISADGDELLELTLFGRNEEQLNDALRNLRSQLNEMEIRP